MGHHDRSGHRIHSWPKPKLAKERAMALTYLNSKLDGFREQAGKAWGEHKSFAESVKADPTLSAEGKQLHINESLTRTRAKLKALEQQERDEIATKLRSAEAAINRTPGYSSTDIISFRDAQDRAERIENQGEGDRVMQRAIASNDTVLAVAVMRRAVESGWTTVYDQFTAAHPSIAEHVEDTAAITQYEASVYSSMDRMVYQVAD